MQNAQRKAAPLGLLGRLRAQTVSMDDLRAAAQLAVKVEFSTIPVYLTGLYSLTEPDCVAYQNLRSVAVEEMFHINQAANLLVALGGTPKFTGDNAPTYPNYLPQANPNTTPFIGLYQASTNTFENVYAAIENPAPAGAPPQGDNYDSIAQLYEALQYAIDMYPGNPFTGPFAGRQRFDIYVGKFGGTPDPITDKTSAAAAITEIVKQGEGSTSVSKPLMPVEGYAVYNTYGKRTDGTYGPIIGTPYELSHFLKFRQTALDTASFPAVLPITSNPRLADYSNPDALNMAEAFNAAYSLMLHALEQTFLPPADQSSPDPYFGTAMTMMHKVLPGLATAMMNTPAHLNGDGSVGPNATPTWEYVAGATPAAARTKVAAVLASGATLNKTGRAALTQAMDGLSRIAAALPTP